MNQGLIARFPYLNRWSICRIIGEVFDIRGQQVLEGVFAIQAFFP